MNTESTQPKIAPIRLHSTISEGGWPRVESALKAADWSVEVPRTLRELANLRFSRSGPRPPFERPWAFSEWDLCRAMIGMDVQRWERLQPRIHRDILLVAPDGQRDWHAIFTSLCMTLFTLVFASVLHFAVLGTSFAISAFLLGKAYPVLHPVAHAASISMFMLATVFGVTRDKVMGRDARGWTADLLWRIKSLSRGPGRAATPRKALIQMWEESLGVERE